MSIGKLFLIWLYHMINGKGKFSVMANQQSSQIGKVGKFLRRAVGFLRILGEVVEQGFIRKDTQHPAFCGCIDWHSCVHGAYALLTAARLAGQDRWAEVVDTV